MERIKGYQMFKDTNKKIIKAFKGQSIFEAFKGKRRNS